MTTRKHALLLASLLVLAPLVGCGEDEAPVTTQRGMAGQGPKIEQKAPPAGGSKAPAGGGSRRSQGGTPSEDAPAEAEPPRPDRPKTIVSREDFASSARDPFHTYLSPALANETAPVEVLDKQRNVKLAEYDFEELKLIAIVNAGRNVEPRALFLSASDKKSKSVRQGEYFSSAEVLLASVNRDYIEIEIIDPELTPGWNMERGERRVIYLKEPKG
jgi:Tfp pilus assembly protein PilP